MRARGSVRVVCGPALLGLIALLACRGEGAPVGLTLEQALGADWGGLQVEEVTSMPADRLGGTAVVLLHGYGGTGSELIGAARTLMDETTRVFLPTSVLPHDGGKGAMWWEFIEGDWPKPYWEVGAGERHWPEPSRQLPLARAAIVALVGEIRERYRPDALALVGYSQGAMLALDVALVTEPPPDRVALLSGYLLLDSFPNVGQARDRHPVVFISHGRADQTVPFARAQLMRKVLEAGDFPVRLAPHGGGHELDAAVLGELRSFLLQDAVSGR